MTDEKDIIIWNAFKKGDYVAYTRLYNKYYKPLNNYGYKFTRDVDLIEDAIHDLFVKLWTSRSNLGSPASIKNYLYKSLRSFLFRKLQSAIKFTYFQEDSYSFHFEVSFDNQLIHDEEERRLQHTIKAVLSRLPGRQQEIIYLRFYEGLSYEEIADIMAIHINSAYKLLYKALDNLQNELNPSTLLVFWSALALLKMDLLISELLFSNRPYYDFIS